MKNVGWIVNNDYFIPLIRQVFAVNLISVELYGNFLAEWAKEHNCTYVDPYTIFSTEEDYIMFKLKGLVSQKLPDFVVFEDYHD
jgi:hypothetical protein